MTEPAAPLPAVPLPNGLPVKPVLVVKKDPDWKVMAPALLLIKRCPPPETSIIPETEPVPEFNLIVRGLLPVMVSDPTSKPRPPAPGSIVKVFAPLVLKDGKVLLIVRNAAIVSL